MSIRMGARLSLLLFLQYFVLGSYFVTVGNFMRANGLAHAIHWVYITGPTAALLAPFFLGLVADRLFASQRVLAVLHLLSGIFLWLAPSMVDNDVSFTAMMLMHSLCFFPTLGLANSTTFRQLTDREKQYPPIRAFGTAGWVAAGILVSGIFRADATSLPLTVAAIASFMASAYSLTLPHTPPAAAGQPITVRSVLGLDALSVLGSRPFFVFVSCSLLLCIPLAAYNAYIPLFIQDIGVESPAFLLTIGQISEVLFMLAIPFLLLRFGFKWVMVFGMVTWAVRYLLFATAGPPILLPMIVFGILLHGIGFDSFYVAGQIYVDSQATPEIRSQAHSLLVMINSGLGISIGTLLSGYLFNGLISGTGTLEQWHLFWIAPSVMTIAVTLMFVGLFPKTKRDQKKKGDH